MTNLKGTINNSTISAAKIKQSANKKTKPMKQIILDKTCIVDGKEAYNIEYIMSLEQKAFDEFMKEEFDIEFGRKL